MSRNVCFATLAAVLVAACGDKGGAKKSGPFVAQGDGIAITAEELKARLDEQSPFVRARFGTLEKKKEFLENLVRFEVLAREAEKQGLAKDPDVQLMTKRMMVQKLVQKSFAADADPAKTVSDAQAEQYYKEHGDEFHRPAKVRVAELVVKQEADAKQLAARIAAEEKKAPGAFSSIARDASEDAATKTTGGDLGFRSKEELTAQLSPQAAEAAFSMKDGEVSPVLPATGGFVLLKRTGWQDPVDRPLEAVKPQIQARLAKENRTKSFDEYLKKLKDQAKIAVNDQELEKVQVSGPTGPMTGSSAAPMGGALPPGHGALGPGSPGAPVRAPAPAAPPPAKAP